MNRETDSSFKSQEATLNSIRGKHMFTIVSWSPTMSLFWWYTYFLPFKYVMKYLFNKVFLNVQQAPSIYPTKPYLSSPSITPPPLAFPCKGTRTPFRTLPHFSPYSLKMFICPVQATAHSGTSLPVPNVSAHMKVSLGRAGTGELGPCWLTQPEAHTELQWTKL